MKYYKIIDNNKLSMVCKTENGNLPSFATEITEAEYNQLLAEIRERAEKVNEYVALIQDEEMTLEEVQMALEEVPAEYREEVAQILESMKPIEEPNQYGIPQEVLEQIQEDTILELIEMGVM